MDYMTKIHEGLSELDFPKPPGIVFKNIDWQGNPTDLDTWSQDMFSETLLEKAAKENQQADAKLSNEKQAEWDAQEPTREQNGENLVSLYENSHYTSSTELEQIDQMYTDAINSLKTIDNIQEKTNLADRLNEHYAAIAPEKKGYTIAKQ